MEEKYTKLENSNNDNLLATILIILGIILAMIAFTIFVKYWEESLKPAEESVSEKQYITSVQQNIKEYWNPVKKTESYIIVVRFKVNKKGEVSDITIIKSSNDKEADQRAIIALEKSKLPPLPPTWEKDTVDIQFTFNYNISTIKRGGN